MHMLVFHKFSVKCFRCQPAQGFYHSYLNKVLIEFIRLLNTKQQMHSSKFVRHWQLICKGHWIETTTMTVYIIFITHAEKSLLLEREGKEERWFFFFFFFLSTLLLLLYNIFYYKARASSSTYYSVLKSPLFSVMEERLRLLQLPKSVLHSNIFLQYTVALALLANWKVWCGASWERRMTHFWQKKYADSSQDFINDSAG